MPMLYPLISLDVQVMPAQKAGLQRFELDSFSLLLIETLLVGGFLAGYVLWKRRQRGVLVRVVIEDGHDSKYAVIGSRDRKSGVISFKGVPYAAPPVGALRFQKPQRFRPASTFATLECLQYAPASLQGYPFHSLLLRPTWQALCYFMWFKLRGRLPPENRDPKRPYPLPGGVSEDCLYVDITTPTTDPSAKLPVMVWLHGGAFMFGQSTERPWTEPERGGVARQGVVNVAVSYRLGALGWTKVEGGEWNVGSHDQVAALEWVRRNVEAFGGDPLNVTLYGESAGAISCTVLAAAGYANKLFHKMILQSGGWQMVMSREQSEATSKELARVLGLPWPLQHHHMLAVSAEELLAAQTEVVEGLSAGYLPFQPVVDGEWLAQHPLQLLEKGAAKGLPCVVLYHEEEEAFFAKAKPELYKVDSKRHMVETLSFQLGPAMLDLDKPVATALAIITELQQVVPDQRKEDWSYLLILATGYMRLAMVSLKVGLTLRDGGSRVFMSRFLVPSPAFLGLAAHLVDLPYLFGNWRQWKPVVPARTVPAREHDLLCEALQHAWASFAKTGDPSGPHPWPALPLGQKKPGGEEEEELPELQWELPFQARVQACGLRQASPTLWRLVERNTRAHYVWSVEKRHLFNGIPDPDTAPPARDHHLLDGL